jgi:hypothetical protein
MRRLRSSAFESLAWLILGLLFAHSSEAQKVTVEFDEAPDFSHYKTFAVRDGRLHSSNPALNSPLVKKQIEAHMERDLAAKGLTQV